MIVLIGIAVIIIVVIIAKRFYRIQPDAMTVISGTLGSGKTLIGSGLALKLLRRNRRKVWWHNLWHPRHKWEKPLLYSTIPIAVSKREMSTRATVDHFLCRAKLVLRSVLLGDEISLICDQMQAIGNQNVLDGYTEFATLFRHYTQGGYVVLTTQNTSKIPYCMRYSAGSVINCQHFRKFLFLYFVQIRNMSISEDVKNVENETNEESRKLLIGLLPFRRRYDTYAFSDRYRTVPSASDSVFAKFKVCYVPKMPKKHLAPFTTSVEVDASVPPTAMQASPVGIVPCVNLTQTVEVVETKMQTSEDAYSQEGGAPEEGAYKGETRRSFPPVL